MEKEIKKYQDRINNVMDSIKEYPNVKVVVATKYMTVEQTKALFDCGIRDFGENRTDLFLEKYNALNSDEINWHFFGVLQTRKIRDVVDRISCLHSLTTISTAKELDKRLKTKLDCFLEINISEEPNKEGVPLQKTRTVIKSLSKCKNIRIIGLMCVASRTYNKEVLRREFTKMKKMQLEIEKMNLDYAPCHELSMGMSNDYKIALECGATYLRLGRIFLD